MAAKTLEFDRDARIWHVRLPYNIAQRTRRTYVPPLSEPGYTYGQALQKKAVLGGTGEIVPYRPTTPTRRDS